MKYHVRYSKMAQKEIRKLPPHIRKRLQTKLEFYYSQDDPLAFAESLTKPMFAMYRWRIGVYRVMFDFERETITVLRDLHRREAYRK